MTYIPRYAEKVATDISRSFKVLYVGGARQVGKTTMLKNLSGESRAYVSLDDLARRTQAEQDPDLFLQQHLPPVLIDEIQYAPQVLSYLKLAVDSSDKRGQYWLTGSQQFAMMKGIQESLAGRVGIIHLLGLSLAEIERRPTRKNPWLPGALPKPKPGQAGPTMSALFEHIWLGSFPALWQSPAPSRDQFFSSYVESYIDRDIAAFFGLERISAFHTFLELTAARTGQQLNYSDLARDAGISVPTAKEWIGILEATSQIMLLRPYHRNIPKRMVKAPKLYWLDTGLAAYLARWNTADSLMTGAAAGAFFETFVVSEIVKSYQFRGLRPPLHYLRDRLGNEIDLVIEQNQVLHPIEIKLRSKVSSQDVASLQTFSEELPGITSQKSVICLTPERFRITEDIDLIPVGEIE